MTSGTEAEEAAGSDSRVRLSGLLLQLSVVFGLLAGLGEGLGFLALQSAGLAPWNLMRLPVPLDMLWVAPLVDALLFLGVGATMALVVLVRPVRASLRVGVFVLTFIVVFDWLAVGLMDRVRHFGIIALAAGIAVHWTRRCAANQARVARRLGRVVVPLALAAFVAVRGGRLVYEAVAQFQLPAAEATAPNVLFIVVDTLRADHVSAYGYRRPTTPRLDRLAEEGVVFDNAFSTSSWTLPSHASLLTGGFPYENLVTRETGLRGGDLTLAEALRALGYRTGGFSANRMWVSNAMGFGRGFLRFEDAFHTPADVLFRSLYGRKFQVFVLEKVFGTVGYPGRLDAADAIRAMLNWIGNDDSAPFFAFANFYDVHEPYRPPPPFRGRFSRPSSQVDRIQLHNPSRPLRPDELQDEMDAYDESLMYVDDQIGHLVDAVRARPTNRPTAIIVTSDHGEFFGEHGGLVSHGNHLYREGIHVPLIVSMPGHVPAGTRVAQAVSNESLPATVMSLVGAAGGGAFSGRDLTRFWREPGSMQVRPILSELDPIGDDGAVSALVAMHARPMKSIVMEQWHYLWHQGRPDELFDVRRDPAEQTNLAGSADLQDVRDALRRQIAATGAVP